MLMSGLGGIVYACCKSLFSRWQNYILTLALLLVLCFLLYYPGELHMVYSKPDCALHITVRLAKVNSYTRGNCIMSNMGMNQGFIQWGRVGGACEGASSPNSQPSP